MIHALASLAAGVGVAYILRVTIDRIMMIRDQYTPPETSHELFHGSWRGDLATVECECGWVAALDVELDFQNEMVSGIYELAQAADVAHRRHLGEVMAK